ncbi:hypothetical protein [Vibrio furnissii]|uniref:hypothetical protein n=1 Tax=Vibrio furnissii TaxID=29494 RepID=UPI0025729F38|nr:hypothetical protein [Vibrio furnissii]WJG22139.1 hypothetical protein QSU95_02950 [Vibrio furnissii]
MSWTRLTSISVTNGSAIVTVNSGSTINIKVGDALLIGGFDLVEIEGVFANQLQLGSNWNHATQSNVAAAIIPTFGDFNHAVEEIRKLRQATTDNLDAMEQWWTKPEGSVVFQSYDGKQFEARSVQQMEKDVTEIEERAESMMTDINAWGFARTEADMEADKNAIDNQFAANGAIHFGKVYSSTVNKIVNEGIWTTEDQVAQAYKFRMGRAQWDTKAIGDSKSSNSVFNLGKLAAILCGMNDADGRATFKVRPACKGVSVFDSATSVLTNFETDVDVKYGDVASSYSEAIERAYEFSAAIPKTIFESGCYNVEVQRSAIRWATDSQSAAAARIPVYNIKSVTYILEFDVSCEKAVSSIGFLNITGWYSAFSHAVSIPAGLDKVTHVKIELPAPTAEIANETKIGLLYNTTGERVISNVSLRPKTNKIVTHPVSLVCLEDFLRPITANDPFAYPFGMLNQKLITVDGIPTQENNFRPIEHFAVYPGDATSRGYGWNLFDGSLTNDQIAQILQDPSHRIYRLNDGTLCQRTLGSREILGLGNGDFLSYLPTGNVLDTLLFDKNKQVSVRGNNDSAPDYFVNSVGVWYSTSHPSGVNDQLGAFKAGRANAVVPSAGINGECYLYIVSTIPRLNQLAYHPDVNKYGTATFSDGLPWNETSDVVRTIKDCAINATNGNLESGISGHPDGLFFDVIYSNGLNGIVDERPKYGAWDASSSEQAAVVREEVNKAVYRGRERLTRWMISKGVPSGSSSNMYIGAGFAIESGETYLAAKSTLNLGYKAWVYIVDSGDTTLSGVVAGTWYVCTAYSRNYQGQIGLVNPVTGGNTWITAGTTSSMAIIVGIDVETNLTVEGNFNYLNVIGHPAEIVGCSALKNGWPGGWMSDLPDNTSKLHYFSRPHVGSSSVSRIYTDDSGDEWLTDSVAIDAVNQAWLATIPESRVTLMLLTAAAAPTKISANVAVYNAESGLPKFIDVFSSADSNYGALLGYSLFNFALKGSNPDTARQRLALTEISLSSLGVLSSGDNGLLHQKHAPMGVLDSSNNTPACKVMMHQTSKSGLASLNIVANELRFNAVNASWSDDSKLKVKNGRFTDLANVSCLAMIHELSKPYGFIKNKN